MTKDEIIDMARQVGFGNIAGGVDGLEELETFAKLVAAHTRGTIFKPDWDNYCQGLIDGATAEREACALIGDGYHDEEANCGDLIRARGEV